MLPDIIFDAPTAKHSFSELYIQKKSADVLCRFFLIIISDISVV